MLFGENSHELFITTVSDIALEASHDDGRWPANIAYLLTCGQLLLGC